MRKDRDTVCAEYKQAELTKLADHFKVFHEIWCKVHLGHLQ